VISKVDHGPSSVVVLIVVPLSMGISAVHYLALVLLPLFAKFDISLTSENEAENYLTAMAERTKKAAIKYAALMDKVTTTKA
jgi:hypothetical protein